MTTLIGTVTKIEKENAPFDKRRLFLKMPFKQSASIQIKDENLINQLNDIEVEDAIEVIVSFHSSTSKLGHHHDNLLAKAIKKI